MLRGDCYLEQLFDYSCLITFKDKSICYRLIAQTGILI